MIMKKIKIIKTILENKYNPAYNYMELIQVLTFDDLAFLESILDTTDIPYYFRDLSIRAKRGLPAFLMVESSRIEDAKELLKDLVHS
jgi:hypothetical protein